MGQFLQGGKNGRSMSFFLKVEPPCDQTWWESPVFFNCHLFIICCACQKHFGWTSLGDFTHSVLWAAVMMYLWSGINAMLLTYRLCPVMISCWRLWCSMIMSFLTKGLTAGNQIKSKEMQDLTSCSQWFPRPPRIPHNRNMGKPEEYFILF